MAAPATYEMFYLKILLSTVLPTHLISINTGRANRVATNQLGFNLPTSPSGTGKAHAPTEINELPSKYYALMWRHALELHSTMSLSGLIAGRQSCISADRHMEQVDV